jgi:hypothetical protein
MGGFRPLSFLSTLGERLVPEAVPANGGAKLASGRSAGTGATGATGATRAAAAEDPRG